MSVRIGYFEDFKSSNTLLLEADADGLRALADTFRVLAAGTLESVAIHELPFMEPYHRVRVLAVRGPHDSGTSHVDGDGAILWARTAEGWTDAAEKIEVLAQSERGHNYLDADDDQVTVQVSRGEYGDRWWKSHG